MRVLRLPTPRVSFGLWFRQPAPQVPVGVRPLPRRSRRRNRHGAGPGVLVSRASPGMRNTPCWREQDLPASPGRTIPRLCIGLRPRTVRRASPWRRFRCCPHDLKDEGTDVADIEAQLRCFAAHCVRFTTPVAVRHATLVPGWRAAPLPDGSLTRWLASKSFHLIVISSFPELRLALSDVRTSGVNRAHLFEPDRSGSAVFPGSS